MKTRGGHFLFAAVTAVSLLVSLPAHAFKATDYFAGDVAGLGARDISVSADALIQAWSNVTAGGPSSIDPGALLDLNLQATGAWDRLVACNGGDAEEARKRYFSAKNLCKSSSADGKKMKSALVQLHQNFRQVLITSNSGPVTALPVRNGDLEYRLPLIHPLFAEMMIETVASVRYAFWDHNTGWFAAIPWGRVDMEVELMLCDTGLQRPDGYCGGDEAVAASNYYSRVYFNVQKLLKASPLGCESYGLWPNASLFAFAKYLVLKQKAEIVDFRPNTYSSYAEQTQPKSCWGQATTALVGALNSTQWGLDFDAHTRFVMKANAEYARIVKAYQ